MCQDRVFCYNKSTILMLDVDSGGDCVAAVVGGIREFLLLAAQFCYESKIALKNKVYF
jgi:hypothetical protein